MFVIVRLRRHVRQLVQVAVVIGGSFPVILLFKIHAFGKFDILNAITAKRS